MRRNRLRASALLAVASLAAAACSGEADPGLMPDPGHGGAASAFEATAGTRAVALGRVVVEVPEAWATEASDSCPTLQDGTVVFRLPGQPECGRPISRDLDTVTLETIEGDDSLLLVMGRARPLGEYVVRQTGLGCRASFPPICDQTVAVPELGVLVQIHVRSDDAETTIRAIRSSLSVLPVGYAGVPPIVYGTSDQDALVLLKDAGLVGAVPDVDFPHYVTGTDPPAGTVLPVGVEVALQVGDG